MEAAGSRFERWVESVYRRTKPRYDLLLIGSTILVIHLVLAPTLLAVGLPLLSPELADWPRVLLIIEVALLGGAPTLFWVVRVHHGSLIKHLRGDADVDPVELWVTSVAELPQGILQALTGYLVPLLVASAYLGVDGDNSAVELISTGGFVAIAALSSAAILYLFWEIALRPVAREIAPLLPEDLILRERGMSLAKKILFLLVTLSLFNGAAIGAVSFNSLGREARLVVTFGAVVVLSVTLSGALVWMIEHSFVSRIDELRRALQTFSSGDRREIKLPPLAGDDLDEVGHAFNEMVERLNRHDAEIQASRARIVTVAVDERRRMERDLHDGAQQHLALLNLQLSVLERNAEDHPELLSKVREMRSSLAEALRDMRDLAHGIYPAALENDGLAAALAEAADRAAVPTSLEVDGVRRASREVEAAVYFCCLEALQNASKHAGEGASATITLAHQNGTLLFTVVDDGVGFTPAADGHGLHNMMDRIGALGGDVLIESAPGSGVTVRGRVPVNLD